jgi:transposase
MVTYLKYSLGVDVSKNEHHVCLSVIDDVQKVTIKATRKFSNTSKGFEELLDWLEKNRKLPLPLTIVLEASGVYHEALAWFMHQHHFDLAIVLPNKAKHYLKALGQKSKNDKIDAAGLARMGAEQRLALWQPCSDELEQLKVLTRHYEQLQQTRTLFKNQLHALKHAYKAEKTVLSSFKRLIEQVDAQIRLIKKQLDKRLNADADLKARVEKITGSIKGLGTLTVLTLVAETAGFSTIDNQRQLASYAGYDVVENQSGKRAGKTRISKKGNSHIRRIMHMAALNMVRYQVKPFEDLYERIYQKTGIKMKGYTAIQRKLLILIYTLWKKNEAYRCPEQKKETTKCLLPEPLFQVCRAAAKNTAVDIKKVAPTSRATQDEQPISLAPVALFQVLQI